MTITISTLEIIRALPKWVQWSLKINKKPYGWVPLRLLENHIGRENIDIAYNAKIIEFDDDWFRFAEQDVIKIYNRLEHNISHRR